MNDINYKNSSHEVKDLFLQTIDYLRTNPKDFAKKCGFRNTEKLYHITSGRNSPGYETLC